MTKVNKALLIDREMITVMRRRLGLSQEELAAKAGLSQHGVSALETGVRDNPTLRTLYALAQALEVSPDVLAPKLCSLSVTAETVVPGSRDTPAHDHKKVLLIRLAHMFDFPLETGGDEAVTNAVPVKDTNSEEAA